MAADSMNVNSQFARWSKMSGMIFSYQPGTPFVDNLGTLIALTRMRRATKQPSIVCNQRASEFLHSRSLTVDNQHAA